MVSERVHAKHQQISNRPRRTSFLMAVQQIAYTGHWAIGKLPGTLFLAPTRSKPCRAARMTPVNASRNNVIFFEHLFLGVSEHNMRVTMR